MVVPLGVGRAECYCIRGAGGGHGGWVKRGGIEER